MAILDKIVGDTKRHLSMLNVVETQKHNTNALMYLSNLEKIVIQHVIQSQGKKDKITKFPLLPNLLPSESQKV